MTPQPRRKPRRVVLGTGELSFVLTSLTNRPIGVEVWSGLSRLFLRGMNHDGESGRLIWEPDPPKAKR